MSTLRHLARWRRAWSSRRVGQPQQRWSSEGGADKELQPVSRTVDAVKEYDAQKYGGFKSWDKLFEKSEKKGVVGRWDWHFWHFLLALIPPGAVVMLAHWAREDMAAKQLEKEKKKVAEVVKMVESMRQRKGATGADTAAAKPVPNEAVELKQRLSELEATVKALAAMQGAQSSASAPAEEQEEQQQQQQPTSSSSSTPPEAGGASPEAAAAAAAATGPAAVVAAAAATGPVPATSPSTVVTPSAGGNQLEGKAPPLPKLPDNPLDRWLPETDCQFCNDTRQQLWGAFKSATGLKTEYDQQQAGKAAPTASSGGGAEGARQRAAPPADKAAAPDKTAAADRAAAAAAVAPAVAAAPDQQSAQDTVSSAVAEAPAVAALDAAPAAPSAASEPVHRPAPGAAIAATSPAAASPAPPAQQGDSSTDSKAAGHAVTSTAAAASSSEQAGEAPPLPKLPDNPLDRWLPETDCQFCNDTRQRLWGAFKSRTGYRSKWDREHEGQAAAGADTADSH